MIYGIKDGTATIQALRYKTKVWTEADARKHCKSREGKFEPAEKGLQMETKQFTAGLKEISGEGKALVVFATLNVKDHDGDVTLPGAFGNQKSKIAGSHQWQLPSQGVANISEEGDDARALLQYNMEISDAAQWYSSIKFNHEHGVVQEFSYGFDVLDSGIGEWEGEQVRFLKKLKVHEISPVMVGAGIDTRVLDVKNQKTLDQEFDDVGVALIAAKNITCRINALAALKAEHGKQLPGNRKEQIKRQLSLLAEIQGELEHHLLENEKPVDVPKIQNLHAQFLKIQSKIHGHLSE